MWYFHSPKIVFGEDALNHLDELTGQRAFIVTDANIARLGFVEQVRRFVGHYAWVETRTQGQLLGQTAVSWTGDANTVWQEGLDPAQMALHQRTLTLALASRDTVIRTFILVASGAARLSVLLATPGGAILALRAAWKFVKQVQAELERHQQITKEI